MTHLAAGAGLVQDGEAAALGLFMDHLPLASEFPAATREQWLKLVEAILKGADFEKKLVSLTYDGLRIEPLYPSRSGGRRRGRPLAAGGSRSGSIIRNPPPPTRSR